MEEEISQRCLVTEWDEGEGKVKQMMRVNGQNVHSEVPCIKHPSSPSHLLKHQIALSLSLSPSLFLLSPDFHPFPPSFSFPTHLHPYEWCECTLVSQTFHLLLWNKHNQFTFDNSWLFYSNFGLGYIKKVFCIFLCQNFVWVHWEFFLKISLVISFFFSFFFSSKFTSIQMTKRLQNYAHVTLTTGHQFFLQKLQVCGWIKMWVLYVTLMMRMLKWGGRK